MENPAPTSLQKRVRERMDALGLNALQAAKRARLGESFVRDILRGRTRSPSADNLAKLAKALETTPEYLRNETAEANVGLQEVEVVGLPVVSSINAGSWLEVTILDDNPEPDLIPVAKNPRYSHAHQYALRIVGDSMDELYKDGSYVICADIWDMGIPLKDGLPVHVEMRRAGGQLVQITIKEIATLGGERVLIPRSSNPRWKPIPLEGDDATEVIVKGVVIGSYNPTDFSALGI
jgi:SOS-response transcriptional repressor LexA